MHHGHLTHLIETYGYGVVVVMVGLEGIGVPVPGEAMLIAASVLAGTTQNLDISLVIAAAVCGAVIGDNTGFLIGSQVGHRLLLRYGAYVGMTPSRIKIGQYLMRRHGPKLVLVARFVTVLRSFSGFFAGANRMPWPRFALWNAVGAILWASTYGGLAYTLGRVAHRILFGAGVILAVAAFAAMVAVMLVLRRHEERFAAEAERALPGPVH